MLRILGFSGKHGSGKTTLAKEFACDIQAKYISFGDYIRNIAKGRNLDYTDRDILRGIGEEQINRGWLNFCQSVLDYHMYRDEELLVVDGVRHLGCLDGFRTLFPNSEIYVVYIDISEELSIKRQRNRGESKIYTYSGKIHMTEEQVDTTLPLIASLILDGNKDLPSLKKQLNEWYEKILCNINGTRESNTY